jgi:hypothetical protein
VSGCPTQKSPRTRYGPERPFDEADVDIGVALDVDGLLAIEQGGEQGGQYRRGHDDVRIFVQAIQHELAARGAAAQDGAHQIGAARQDLAVIEFGQPGKARTLGDDHVQDAAAIGADHVAIHGAGDETQLIHGGR